MVTDRGLLIRELESVYVRDGVETFKIGDTVRVHFKIREGKRERVQVFEGIVIAMNGSGVRKAVTVRKLSFNNVAVERVFPLYSPKIGKIDVVRHGRIRRSKLYYLRKRRGKAAQVKRLIDRKSGRSVGDASVKVSDKVSDDKVSDKVKLSAEGGSSGVGGESVDGVVK